MPSSSVSNSITEKHDEQQQHPQEENDQQQQHPRDSVDVHSQAEKDITAGD